MSNRLLTLSILLMSGLLPASAQDKTDEPGPPPIAMGSTNTDRFIAVHGSRAVVMGYPQNGLEVWGYPWQILDHYRIGFVTEGGVSETDGNLVLSRIVEDVDSVTRIYTGPGYVVRESLFAPLDQAEGAITYEVNAERPLSIRVHFAPVMNLMWPASAGGQSIAWRDDAHGYVLSASTLGNSALGASAIIASPDIAAHDEVGNNTIGKGELTFALQPRVSAKAGPATASVFISLLAKREDAPHAMQEISERNRRELEASAAHYRELRNDAIEIRTPDEAVNKALAWAEVALDQAWVCEDRIGCGVVAGYGPSRPGRRPQYDWYFAGDGLVAVNGLVSAGEFARAREELEFIAKYQNAESGMIWHEQSLSAGYLDWQKLPYMFAHVDITFDYLTSVARYVKESGDVGFATKHWPSIDSAYRYCRSLIDATDHLPHIPAGKEGADEQHRPVEDLGLSSAWVSVADSFASLARVTGHSDLADDAMARADLAKQAIADHYWSKERNFWIGGFAAGGDPIIDLRSGPGEVVSQGIFSAKQNDAILDQIATTRFVTNWGLRGTSTESPIFDPWSYSTGSVSALHTTNTAVLFWKEHRPASAWQMWRAIVPWNELDSLGHIHEVVAGNFYRPQAESVPEQTWSSAGILDAAVRGLLGIDRSGQTLTFAPHLPPDWEAVSLKHLHLVHSELSIELRQTIDSVDLAVTDSGEPAHLDFEPMVPLGATITGAECNGHPVAAEIQTRAQDEHAKLQFDLPAGNTQCHLRLKEGVQVILPFAEPKVGDASSAMRIDGTQYRDHRLSVDAELSGGETGWFVINTRLKPAAATAAEITAISTDRYRVKIAFPAQDKAANGYLNVHVEISFSD
jgi:glycogen debranching enzyme